MSMGQLPIALKRLTRNDVSWLQPKAKSHQCAINLPTKSFNPMFQDLLNQEGNVLRDKFMVHWYQTDGTKLTHSESEIAYYHSKAELRLLQVPRTNMEDVLKELHLLLFRREGRSLHITHLEPNCEHLVSELGRHDLVDILPKLSTKPQDREHS